VIGEESRVVEKEGELEGMRLDNELKLREKCNLD